MFIVVFIALRARAARTCTVFYQHRRAGTLLKQLHFACHTENAMPKTRKSAAKQRPSARPADKPTANAPLPRKTRDQLTTAIARAEVRDTRPPVYDPLETVAPLRPYTYISESKFKYDQFISQRRYARRGLHGENDSRFDPEQHDATPVYKQRLESMPLDVYTEADPFIDDEREANLIEQPPEAQEQLRTDLRNQSFIASIKGPVTRAEHVPVDLRRAREVAAQAQRTTRQIETQLAKSTVQNPDFFTELAGYRMVEPAKKAAVITANDDALIRAIDAELTTLAENEDDDDEDDNIRDQHRAALEKEREELLATHNKDNDDDDDGDDDDADDKVPEGAAHASAVPVITAYEAQQLLECNPLVSLHTNLRTHFLQLPEAAKVWQLLYPIVCQHESHRQHYNIVELVRAMNLCGAKYDGCIKLRARARLSDLLDRKFYASFMKQGRLVGGHEHWPEDESYTTFTVFKFYLVRRDKANTEALAEKGAAATTASTTAAKKTNALMDKEATNIDNQIDQGRRHMVLNTAGLYDADERPENTDDDGTDEYGTLHDIKFLDREFMFSLRVVAVDPVDLADCEPYNGYVSMEDNDYELPREAAVIPRDGETQTQQSVWSINNERTNRGTSNTSTSRPSGSGGARATRSGSRFEDDDDDDLDAMDAHAEDAAAYVHSDDDDDDAERLAYEASMQTKPFMPPNSIVLTGAQAHHLVGKWKAPEFMQRVNTHMIGQLCIRSFMFYASAKK